MGSKFQSIYGREDQPLFRLTLVVVKARSRYHELFAAGMMGRRPSVTQPSASTH